MGLQVIVTLERPGFRINRRQIMKRRIPLAHKISKEETNQLIYKSSLDNETIKNNIGGNEVF